MTNRTLRLLTLLFCCRKVISSLVPRNECTCVATNPFSTTKGPDNHVTETVTVTRAYCVQGTRTVTALPLGPTTFQNVTSSTTSCSQQSSSSSTTSPSTAVSLASTTGYINAVYYVNWAVYGRNFVPQSLPQNITHIFYAFANLHSNGSVYSSDEFADTQKVLSNSSSTAVNTTAGCVEQLFLLKKVRRNLKVMLSIGGWTFSDNFPNALSTSLGRRTFATSAVALMKDWGFDGIDIDWEYPASDEEAKNFLSALKEVKLELLDYQQKHNLNRPFLLTIAISAGLSHYQYLLPNIEAISQYVDYWSLMAYDYAGSWSPATAHQANLYPKDNLSTPFSTHQAIHDYINAGIEIERLILGIPLYGRSFESTKGLGKPFVGVGNGSWEKGAWDYKELPRPGAIEVYDNLTVAAYSYNEMDEELISYDSIESAQGKAEYIRDMGLGGAMFWESSADKNGRNSLIATTAARFGQLDSTQNCLTFPDSRFANIAAGL